MVKARLDLFYEPYRKHFFMRTSDHLAEGDTVLVTVDADPRPVAYSATLLAIDSYGVTVRLEFVTTFYPFQSVISIVKANA
jgi:uncharacterized protein (DUF2249 family)